MGMKFTEEMINEDEKRWHARDVVTELGYCGNYMCDRKNMTNHDIRFYAYIMRKAYYLLKEQEPKAGHWTVLKNCSNAGVYCSECQTKVFDHYPMPKKLSRFFPHCGAKMDGETE